MLLFGLRGTLMDKYSPETEEELKQAIIALATGKRSPFDVRQALHFGFTSPPYVLLVGYSRDDKEFGITVRWRGGQYYVKAPAMDW